jgi:hypothetical protein
MIDRNKYFNLAAIAAILASIGVFLALGSDGAAGGSLICLIVVLASMPYHRHRMEKMRRGKQILNGPIARRSGWVRPASGDRELN